LVFCQALPFAQYVVTAVDQNPKHPSRNFGVAFKASDRSIDFQERFLHRVFGIILAPEHVKRQAFHARGVELIQPLKRMKLSPLAAFQELCVSRIVR
jgi:hypothetical protein